MRGSLLAGMLLALIAAGPAGAQRYPVCEDKSKGPQTITPRMAPTDSRYGYYCGRGNRCPPGNPNCKACDSVDEACRKHDACWSEGPCAGTTACEIGNFFSFATRERLPAFAGQGLTPLEAQQLAQMRRCNVALCNDVRDVTKLTADMNEARMMPELTFGGCAPHLLPVIGGTWMRGSAEIKLEQNGTKVTGTYSDRSGGPVSGAISGDFVGGKFTGDYQNKNVAGDAGKRTLNLTFSTIFKAGQGESQDKLDGTATGGSQKINWTMTRD